MSQSAMQGVAVPAAQPQEPCANQQLQQQQQTSELAAPPPPAPSVVASESSAAAAAAPPRRVADEIPLPQPVDLGHGYGTPTMPLVYVNDMVDEDEDDDDDEDGDGDQSGPLAGRKRRSFEGFVSPAKHSRSDLDKTCHVANFGPLVTREDLAALFSDCQGFMEFRLLTNADGSSRCCGFAIFSGPDAAIAAIKAKNQVPFNGFRLSVTKAVKISPGAHSGKPHELHQHTRRGRGTGSSRGGRGNTRGTSIGAGRGRGGRGRGSGRGTVTGTRGRSSTPGRGRGRASSRGRGGQSSRAKRHLSRSMGMRLSHLKPGWKRTV
ncbi:hypothetical protein Pelo_3825 [Pelomyxa schiedti]|nr:hypothetical protein Pelo_3825 [Pelomyxa schiedti]